MTRRHRSLAVALLFLAACAGSPRRPDAPVIIAGSVCSGVRGLSPESVGGASAGEKPVAPAMMVVASEPAAKVGDVELIATELGSQRTLWKKAVRASARPQILESLVVTSNGDELIALDLATGQERFRSPLGRPLFLGAAQSGETVVLTASAASWDPKQRGSSLIALDAHSGSERWRRDVPYALSAPAIRGKRALVVADHADLWTLDLESGANTGCGTVGGNTIEWLSAEPNGVLLGAAEARQLAPDARGAEASLELARRDLPGRPFIRSSSYTPVPAAKSAHGRVAAIAPLHTSATGPTLAGDMFYFVFYRDVFGFRADGSLAWAQLVDADIARAQASDQGLWVITEAGILLQLDAATGEPKNAQALGVRVASADMVVPASAAAPPAAAAETAAAAGAPSTAPASTAAWHAPKPYTPTPEALARLQASLRRVADDTDARLLPARFLAVDELAALDSPSATADLLAVYAAPNTPTQLRDRIAKRLRERTSGSEHLVAALAQHQDFIEQQPAPPLRAIVPGVVTQEDARGIPGLIDQLFDPATPVADLGLVVSAIDALGGDRAREPLRRFFTMYRADSSLAEDPSALVLAARALLARNDAASRSMLEATRDSDVASKALRESLASLLAPPPAAAPEQKTEVAAATAPEAAPPPIEIRTLLDAARPQLAPCVDAARARSPKLTSVRLWFVALPDGSVRDVHVTPIDKQLAGCLGEKLAELRLPSLRKQLVGFQLTVTNEAAPASEKPSGDEPFWASAARRAKDAKTPVVAPWWQDQNPLFVVMDQTGRVAQPPPEAPATARAAQPLAAPTKTSEAKPGPAHAAAQPAATAQPPASGLKPAPATQPAAPEDAWWLPQESKR